MQLNHVNLAVSDVQKAKAFLETYFGLRCVAEADSAKLVVLVDDNKSVVTLSNFKEVDDVVYPGAFHVGFMQTSRDKVDAIFERLQADGYQPGPRKDFHGAWTFYLRAPGGYTLEVGHQYAMPSALAA